MRDFPVTEDELDSLFQMGLLATFCFFLGTGAIGYAMSLFKDIALASAPADVVAFWGVLKWVLLAVGILMYLFGGLAFVANRNHISRIKDQTAFD